jgi:molybdopterin-synthase adenylyltransferase
MTFLLSELELNRYHRQIICEDWGAEGQRKIKSATVFMVGAGGLGGPASIYLAVAGVGRLRICDDGKVERSNLNRQILYTDEDIHQEKVRAACKALTRLNPHIEVEGIEERITPESVARLVGQPDIIVDCLDNFETRYILNEYAVAKGLPLVHAGVEGIAGQITFIHPPETACLRCIIPEAPPRKEVFPIVGATAGIIGCLEAFEVLKHLTGIGPTLKGFLMMWSGFDTDFIRIEVGKDPHCPVCGEGRGIGKR